jgi:ABC-type amino acid transport substrate-binding protein
MKHSLKVVVAGLICLFATTYAGAAEDSMEEMTRLLKLRLGTDAVDTPRTSSADPDGSHTRIETAHRGGSPEPLEESQ